MGVFPVGAGVEEQKSVFTKPSAVSSYNFQDLLEMESHLRKWNSLCCTDEETFEKLDYT